ncbi:MAG: hypothetical protein FJ102_09985 [Deltaproteobacteria bacterium]|nr:hypothetical protein [Deltaproteobacteria bacterium]
MLSLVAIAIAAPLCIEDGAACRDTVHGWTLLQLRGDDTAIGRQYAELMGPELRLRYVPMMDRMWAELPGVLRSAIRGRDRRSSQVFDAGNHARMAALERGIDLDRGRYHDYAWISELSSIGPSLMIALGGRLQLDDVRAVQFGARCTSILGPSGEGTLHARNLDFPGMDFWQPNQSLVMVDPRDAEGRPDGERYAIFGTLGEMFAGTTTVNASGLVVTVHVHASRDVALLDGRGRMGLFSLLAAPSRAGGEWGIYRLVETLARRQPSVSAALDALAPVRTLGAWTLVLSDPSGDSAVVDIDARDQRVARGARSATNTYRDPAMHERELVPAAGPFLGSVLRHQRADAGLAAAGDQLDVDEAIGILRNRVDGATGRERVASPNSVLSIDTSQSLAIEARRDGRHRLWMAEPQPDGRSPAALAAWFAVDFDALALLDTRPAAPLPEGTAAWAQARQLLVDARQPAHALEVLDRIDDDGARLMGAWLAASMDDLGGASGRLATIELASLSAHHRALAGWLGGELHRRGPPLVLRGGADDYGAYAPMPREMAVSGAWRDALAALDADAIAHPERARYHALLRHVLAARLASSRPLREFPAPDLKFQDVLSLPR